MTNPSPTSKEDILDKAMPDIDYDHYQFNEFQRSVAYEAMDEYSKQQAIAYNRWIQSFENTRQAKNFHNVNSDEELYNLFLQSQNK